MPRHSRKTSRPRRLPVWFIPLLCVLFTAGCVYWVSRHSLTEASRLTPLPSTRALPVFNAERPAVPAVAYTVRTADEDKDSANHESEPQEQDYQSLTSPLGNTYGNLSNGGYALVHGNDLYYITPTGIYREPLSGGPAQRVTETGGSHLNADSGWLYFLDTEGYIQKVTTDGKTGWRLCDQTACSLTLAGNWLYYIETEKTRRLFRLQVDGTGRQQLTECDVMEVCPYDGWLYCAGFSSLFRIRPDGSKTEPLLDKRCVYLQPRDHDLYAVRGDTQYGGSMVKIDLTTMDIRPLSENTARCMVVEGTTIYYRNDSKMGFLFAIGIDGGDPYELVQKPVDQLCLAGNWFFYKRDGLPGLCRMRLDGSGAEELP